MTPESFACPLAEIESTESLNFPSESYTYATKVREAYRPAARVQTFDRSATSDASAAKNEL